MTLGQDVELLVSGQKLHFHPTAHLLPANFEKISFELLKSSLGSAYQVIGKVRLDSEANRNVSKLFERLRPAASRYHGYVSVKIGSAGLLTAAFRRNTGSPVKLKLCREEGQRPRLKGSASYALPEFLFQQKFYPWAIGVRPTHAVE